MSCHRVNEAEISLSEFDVVGCDNDDEHGFINHTGLAHHGGSHQAAEVSVLEMGPPLRGQDNVGKMRADTVGTAELTDDEVQKIKNFIVRNANEHEVFRLLSRSRFIEAIPQMYCIHPHESLLEEADGRFARVRFSCAGFVFEAYKEAGITLLDLHALPLVDMAVISAAYGRHLTFMEDHEISTEELGLQGDGPWPVMLCGYLFHALNRKANDIRNQPYSPNAEDRSFA